MTHAPEADRPRYVRGEKVRLTVDATVRHDSEDGCDLEYEYPTELGPRDGRIALDSDAVTVRRLTVDEATPITALGYSVRVRNSLHREGIRTVGDLVARDGWDLLDIRNSGVKSLAEVIGVLAEHGFALKEPAVPLPELPAWTSHGGGEPHA